MLKPLPLATAVAGALACLGTVSLGQAAEAPAYEMVAYTDGAGSRELFEGRYEAAIAAAAAADVRRRGSVNALRASTNLCVAHALRREFAAAEDACVRALSLAREADQRPGTRIREHTETAKALSNLGVLNALKGDRAAARSRLESAERISADWSAPRRNLEHLERLERLGERLQQVARAAE